MYPPPVCVHRSKVTLVTRKDPRNGDQVKFEECIKGSNPECLRTIGPKLWYTVEELQSQRAVETFQAYGSIVANVGVVALSIFGGMGAGSMIVSAGATNLAASVGGGLAGIFIGAPLGAMGGITLVTTVNALNPVEQFRQSGVISDDVINDRPVTQSNMSKYIERLELVLEKLK